MRSKQEWLYRPRDDDLRFLCPQLDTWLVRSFVRSFIAFKSLILPDVTFTVSSKLFIELKLSTEERIDLNSGRFMYMTAKFPFLK
jgi:hypothetical protein